MTQQTLRVFPGLKFSRNELRLDESKPVILVISDSPCIHTGLGKIARSLWTKIYDGGKYNIVQLAFWHQLPMETVPWPVLTTLADARGALDPRDKNGEISISRVLDQIRPSLVWINGDPWTMAPLMRHRDNISCPIIAYVTVDGGPLDAPDSKTGNGWSAMCSKADLIVPYVRWGGDLLKKQYPGAKINDAIPCGVDTNVFRPITANDRAAIRARHFKVGADTRMFMTVARNQSRKNLPVNLAALHFLVNGFYGCCPACGTYTMWERDYVSGETSRPASACRKCGGRLIPGSPRGDIVYYMHTALDDLGPDSWRIDDLLEQFGLVDAVGKAHGVLLNQDLKTGHGVPDELLVKYYQAADVYALASTGEGFGMPALEAMACGVPVVYANYSALPDFAVGRSVECASLVCEPLTSYWRGQVCVDDWAAAISETADIMHTEAGEEMRGRCRAAALRYSWEPIAARWMKVLDSMLVPSSLSWSWKLTGV